jgi:phosphatidylglycerophosphatase A
MTAPKSDSTPPAHESLRERARRPYPTLAWICGDPGRLLAFGFGSGLIRPMSGTWGTAFAWLIWFCAARAVNDLAIGLFLAASFAYGSWACDRVGRELKVSDHMGVVWDEMVAFWLVLWLTPAGWLPQLCAFLLFRFFDIVKPQPIKFFDARLTGGFGVMWDDIVAAAYALLVMAIAVRLGAFV